MSSRYTIHRPVKDQANKIIGYGIQYHGGNQAFGGNGKNVRENDFATADIIYSPLTTNTDKLSRGLLNFATFATTFLMKKAPHPSDKGGLVAQIDGSVIIHPLAMHMVQQCIKEGYQVTTNEFQLALCYLRTLGRIDYIKLNVQTTPEPMLRDIIDIIHSMKKQCIAVGIDREGIYQKIIRLGVDALEGPYMMEELTTQTHSSGYLQSNFLHPVVVMTRDGPDMEETKQTISVDTTLTYGLLWTASSCYYTFRRWVTGVRQVIMTMGLSELRQWVYLLNASNTENQMEEGMEEFLRMSLTRTNSCGKPVSCAKGIPISKLDTYLMGMFSTLNYLVDVPLIEVLRPTPLCVKVKEVLLQHTGQAGMLYGLALSYEHVDWEKIDKLTGELGIPMNLLISLYFTCMEGVDRAWIEMNRSVQRQITDDIKIDT